jgi:hypothetical protein
VLVTCVSIYVLSALTGADDVSAVCLNPHALVQRFQLYRHVHMHAALSLAFDCTAC